MYYTDSHKTYEIEGNTMESTTAKRKVNRRSLVTTVTLRPEIRKKLDEEAQKLGIDRSGMVALCINQYFRTEEAYNLLNKATDLYEQARQMAEAQQVTLWDSQQVPREDTSSTVAQED